jgi:hypothetical protein
VRRTEAEGSGRRQDRSRKRGIVPGFLDGWNYPQATGTAPGCVRADEALEGEFYADHPHAKANALSVEVEHPYVGKYLRYGGLVEFSLTPGLYRTSTQIAQHTKPLLREIGYDDQQIEDLGMRGIVQWADPSVGGEP